MQLLDTGYSLPAPLGPGDLVVFGGHSWLSTVIKFTTDRKNHAISHCGVMVSDNTIAQSTTLNGENGVSIDPMEHWLEEYPGEVWVKYLNKDVFKTLDKNRMIKFLLEQDGRPYDKSQVVFAAIGLDRPDSWGNQKWYCSELAIAAYKEGGVVPINLQMGISPAKLAEFRIFDPQYWQLKGKLKELK